MGPVYDADWIEPGMHVTNLGRREMPDDSADKFDVVIRQGTADVASIRSGSAARHDRQGTAWRHERAGG